MHYPVPPQQEFFLYDYKTSIPNIIAKKYPSSSTYKNSNKLTSEFVKHIQKHQNMLSSIPFVENIYLCNSITFNALHENSDIDLTIITQPKRIRTAKFFLTWKLLFHRIKRYKSKTSKRFCTSFFLSTKSLNLFPIKLAGQTDIYLNYWLAHLVALYSRKPEKKNILMESNKRMNTFLANHPLSQVINIGISCQYGTSPSKQKREKILSGWWGDRIEQCIKYIRLPIILWKKKRLKKHQQDIIINDDMLKFHGDQRSRIQFLFDLKK